MRIGLCNCVSTLLIGANLILLVLKNQKQITDHIIMDPFGIKLGTVLSYQPFKKTNLAVVRKQIILNFRQGTGK